jgi:uncharacterized protein involved in exopolysaccharide biosynthesis
MPNDDSRQPLADRGTDARDYAFRVYALDDSGGVRLRDLWDAFWGARLLILGAALATAVAAYLLTFLITPVYRSTVLVSPVTESTEGSGLAALASQVTGLAAIGGFDLSGSNRTAEAVATLRSRAFTEQFIRDRNLLPVLFADAWDAEGKRWISGAPPTMWEAYDLFDSIREVEEDIETGLVTVEVNWSDPALAARWANGLVEDVNRILRSRALKEVEQNLTFLRGELEKSSQVQLQASIYSLIEAQMQNAMLASVKLEYAFKVIDPATVAERRSWPNRLLFAILGLGLGAVAGMLVSVWRASSRRQA